MAWHEGRIIVLSVVAVIDNLCDFQMHDNGHVMLLKLNRSLATSIPRQKLSKFKVKRMESS